MPKKKKSARKKNKIEGEREWERERESKRSEWGSMGERSGQKHTVLCILFNQLSRHFLLLVIKKLTEKITFPWI